MTSDCEETKGVDHIGQVVAYCLQALAGLISVGSDCFFKVLDKKSIMNREQMSNEDIRRALQNATKKADDLTTLIHNSMQYPK